MTFRVRSCPLLAAALIACISVPLPAQEPQTPPTSGAAPARAASGERAAVSDTPQQLMTDYVHYLKIAQVELANATGQKLLDSGATNADLANMLDDTRDAAKRFQEAVDRAIQVPELEPIAAELWKRVEGGRLDLARDPKRIEEAVKMLVGAQRERLIGKQRLIAAREYAAPPLLREITEGTNQQLKLEAQKVLVELGGSAVAPLNVALLNLTGASQRLVADILGTIKHPNAAPYLRELSMSESAAQEARDAAKRAFDNLGVADASLSTLYSNLARQYFDGNESLISFPDEPTNNVWRYNNFTGLSPRPVPTPIFHDVMAMELAAKAVALDPGNAAGLSLFVASDLKRENDLPEGAVDPLYGDNKYTPDFYATIFGTQTCLDVLGLGIDKLNTPLVRDAIAALSKTTGGANLFARTSGRQPLMEALTYPDRRVQYEAALTLAHALPQQKFSGDQTVVPILASAVRQGAKAMAVIVADNEENRSIAAQQLEQMGFEIVASGASAAAVGPDVNRAVGVDFVLVRVSSAEETRNTIEMLRRTPKSSAAPIVVLAALTDAAAIGREYRNDPRVIITQARRDEQISSAIETVMKRGAGGRIDEAESEEYAIRALEALRDIAISRSPAYSIMEAESAMIDALDVRQGGTKLLVADILALIDGDNAQRKLFDAALNASAEDQVELLRRVADSVRLFGDKAEERHVSALVELIGKAEGDVAEAAATVHGALNLPTSGAVGLLPAPSEE